MSPPYDDEATLGDLAFIDEQHVDVRAATDVVWDAAVRLWASSSTSRWKQAVVRLLGCEPASSSGWQDDVAGAAAPGFLVVAADRPERLVLAGQHRFARYAIVATCWRSAGCCARSSATQKTEPTESTLRCQATAAAYGVAAASPRTCRCRTSRLSLPCLRTPR